MGLERGVFQFFVVRWIVGLNGGESDVDRQTFSFPVEYAKLKTVMLGRVFRSIAGLTLRDGRRDQFILLANYAAGPEKIVLGLSPDPQDKAKSILATVAYTRGPHSIRRTEEADASMEANLLFLEKKLNVSRDPHDSEDPLSDRVLAYALKPTRPSVAGISDIGRYHLFAMGFTVALVVAMTVAFLYKIIDENSLVDSLVLVGIALVVELGPLIRESLSKRPDAFSVAEEEVFESE